MEPKIIISEKNKDLVNQYIIRHNILITRRLFH